MSAAVLFQTRSAGAAPGAFRGIPLFRPILKVAGAFLPLGALLALGQSGHVVVATWLGLMLVTWSFFIGAAKASADDD